MTMNDDDADTLRLVGPRRSVCSPVLARKFFAILLSASLFFLHFLFDVILACQYAASGSSATWVQWTATFPIFVR